MKNLKRSYRDSRAGKEFLNCLPTLCICAINSLLLIFSHCLLSFTRTLCNSCINFGSFFFMSNLLRRRYLNYRVSLLPVNLNDFQFGFYFDHMFKVPAYQCGNIINSCDSDVEGIGKILFRNNLSIAVDLSKLPGFFGDRKKLYLVFVDNVFKNLSFGRIGRIFNLLNSYVGNIQGITKYPSVFEESGCFNYNFRILRVQPVYNRCINVYPHDPNNSMKYKVSQEYANWDINADINKDNAVNISDLVVVARNFGREA